MLVMARDEVAIQNTTRSFVSLDITLIAGLPERPEQNGSFHIGGSWPSGHCHRAFRAQTGRPLPVIRIGGVTRTSECPC